MDNPKMGNRIIEQKRKARISTTDETEIHGTKSHQLIVEGQTPVEFMTELSQLQRQILNLVGMAAA